MIPPELFRKIRRLDVRTRGRVAEFFGGQYHSAFKGRGMTFSEVRAYTPGDDVRTIDWNVTARMGEPFVKLFEEEREQTVLLVVDASASADSGLHGRLRRDVAAEACALVAFSAQRNGDRVGLVLVAGEVEHVVPPGTSRTHGLRLVRDLYAHTPRTPGTDLGAAFDRALRLLRRRALVVVVSDFAASRPYEAELRRLAAKHDVVAVHVYDPEEALLPPEAGLVPLVDAETGATVWLDARDGAARARLGAALDAQRATVERTLVRAGADPVPLATTEDPADALARFFRRRNRR